MTPINKFKSEIGEDFYVERVAHYAADKNIAGAVSVCENCGKFQLSHKPGACKRSDKSESTYSEEELSKIRHCINEDIIKEIIRDASDVKREESSVNDKLAAALEKISEVLGQRSASSQVVTKVKVPPTWAKESFADYKEEVEAWVSAHPGDNFCKYSEFLNELKRNKVKSGLSDYVSSIVVERTRSNKTVSAILNALKEKYDLTKKEKFDCVISMMKNFKFSKVDSGEQIFAKIEKLETEFKALEVGKNINYFLATFILNEIAEGEVINEIEKRTIQDDVDGAVKDENIMCAVKKSFKRMKIEGKREIVENTAENKTFYSNGGFDR